MFFILFYLCNIKNLQSLTPSSQLSLALESKCLVQVLAENRVAYVGDSEEDLESIPSEDEEEKKRATSRIKGERPSLQLHEYQTLPRQVKSSVHKVEKLLQYQFKYGDIKEALQEIAAVWEKERHPRLEDLADVVLLLLYYRRDHGKSIKEMKSLGSYKVRLEKVIEEDEKKLSLNCDKKQYLGRLCKEGIDELRKEEEKVGVPSREEDFKEGSKKDDAGGTDEGRSDESVLSYSVLEDTQGVEIQESMTKREEGEALLHLDKEDGDEHNFDNQNEEGFCAVDEQGSEERYEDRENREERDSVLHLDEEDGDEHNFDNQNEEGGWAVDEQGSEERYEDRENRDERDSVLHLDEEDGDEHDFDNQNEEGGWAVDEQGSEERYEDRENRDEEESVGEAESYWQVFSAIFKKDDEDEGLTERAIRQLLKERPYLIEEERLKEENIVETYVVIETLDQDLWDDNQEGELLSWAECYAWAKKQIETGERREHIQRFERADLRKWLLGMIEVDLERESVYEEEDNESIESESHSSAKGELIEERFFSFSHLQNLWKNKERLYEEVKGKWAGRWKEWRQRARDPEIRSTEVKQKRRRLSLSAHHRNERRSSLASNFRSRFFQGRRMSFPFERGRLEISG